MELTEERAGHIAERHPELLPEHLNKLVETLAQPEEIRRSAILQNGRMLSKWFEDFQNGKHVVVVVISDLEKNNRHWIITAYVARKLMEGETEWKRD